MKYAIAYLVAAVLALFAWGWQGRNAALAASEQAQQYQSMYNAEKLAVAALAEGKIRAERVLKNRATAAEKLLAQTTKERDDLHKALEESPDWAGASVPSGVRQLLESN